MDNIRKYFNYVEVNNNNVCQVENCGKILKGNLKANLKRHLITNHKTIAANEELIPTECLSSNQDGSRPKKRKLSFVKVGLDSGTVIKGCVKLVTKNNFPLSLMDAEGFTDIFKPISDALNININSRNVLPKIKYTAGQFKDIIRKELNGKMVSLKVDSATRKNRSVVGINVQFIKDAKVIVRTLGMICVKERQTGGFLKTKILECISSYDVDVKQLYSITVDNGSNMIKAVDLLRDEQHLANLTVGEQMSELEFTTAADDDVNLEGREVNTENDEENVTGTGELIDLLNCVRCAVHTLQLVALDVLKDHEVQEKLKLIRIVLRSKI